MRAWRVGVWHSLDNTLKLWEARTGALIRTFEGHFGWVRSVAFDIEGLANASSLQCRYPPRLLPTAAPRSSFAPAVTAGTSGWSPNGYGTANEPSCGRGPT